MGAVPENPLAAYRIRSYEEGDRGAANALGASVVDWWHREVPGAALHLVVETVETGQVVGHLQARDRGVPEPSRRAGQCHFMLIVAPEHRRRGIGGCLLDRLEGFARHRQATLLYVGVTESPDLR
ncbi:hypothetical protein BH11ARM2_BH11ARM2_18580 [soil metagenome]